jgi:8-oxo-dGTP pyrophosphatase MutT (NUDIX family)
MKSVAIDSALRDALRSALTPPARVRAPQVARPAAVLLPLVEDLDPWIVFTKRTDHLRRHPGEISFPGGMCHDEDLDLLHTALRETQEELGLAPEDVDVLGALSPLQTFTSGTSIVPFVGIFAADPVFTANPAEIAEVLEFPVDRLLEVERPMAWTREDRTFRGYVYELDGHTVWGATARILNEFLAIYRRELA